MCTQVVGVISGTLKALGNFNAGITKSLIELYVAALASGEVSTVLSSGARTFYLAVCYICCLAEDLV